MRSTLPKLRPQHPLMASISSMKMMQGALALACCLQDNDTAQGMRRFENSWSVGC